MGEDTRFELSQCRNTTVLRLNAEEYLLFATASLGGIGSKPDDAVQVPADVAGYACARAALMDVMALGGMPMFLMNTFCGETDSSGQQLMEGVRRQMEEMGMDPSFALPGSVKENVPVRQTGIGVTAVGAATEKDIAFGGTRHLDAILCIGLPKSVQDDLAGFDDSDILKMSTLRKVLEIPTVHEVVPVGPRGIDAELEDLMRLTDLTLQYENDIPVELGKSAGPATCALVMLPVSWVEEVSKLCTEPVTLIGHYLERREVEEE